MSRLLSRRRFLQRSSLIALAPYLTRGAAQQLPRSGFGAHSTAEEVTAGLDLTGKTALITGVNSGIGHETMRVLALRGAHVLGTARTAVKGREACASVAGRATPLVLELTDFDSIVACADQIRAMHVPIDMLICNAGVLLSELEQVRGLEKHFVVNHLGHFVLVNRLLEQVKAAPQGRVVVVSSGAHRNTAPEGIEFDNLSGTRNFSPGRAYGQSKLANGLFSRELARRLEGSNATSNSLHPGLVDTNIFRHMSSRFAGRRMKTVEQGAATTCYVAAHPALAGVSGRYFEDCNMTSPGGHMENDALAAQLWQVSEELSRGFLS